MKLYQWGRCWHHSIGVCPSLLSCLLYLFLRISTQLPCTEASPPDPLLHLLCRHTQSLCWSRFSASHGDSSESMSSLSTWTANRLKDKSNIFSLPGSQPKHYTMNRNPSKLQINDKILNSIPSQGRTASNSMIHWGRRRVTSASGPAIDALKQFQHQSQQRMRARRFVFLVSTVVFPLSCLSLYDRLVGYPEPLGRHRFPLIARLYIRKSMLLRKPDDLEGIAKDLDSALGAVLTSGLGAASPQATALVIYLSQLYLNNNETLNSRLEEALAALLHKPHVGESLDDEKARLKMGFEVVKRLHSSYSAENAGELLDRYETIVRKCPPQISFHLLQDLASYRSLHTSK